MYKRVGNTLYTAIVSYYVERDSWNCKETATRYLYGNNTGLFVPIFNAQAYGGAAI